MSKQDTYVAKMKLQLDELNLKMKAIEIKAKEAKDDAGDVYMRQMAKLRADSDTARLKLEELRGASEDSWHKMVGEMEKMREAFVHAFHDFKSRV